MDGFQLASGVAALIAAPALLVKGAAPIECVLLFVSGFVIVAVQRVISADAELQPLDAAHAALAAMGLVCLVLAMTYLTRSAEDLPRLLPGHDADSQSLRLVPGVINLLLASVTLSRTAASVRPGAGRVPFGRREELERGVQSSRGRRPPPPER
jgi:hypothetical protein